MALSPINRSTKLRLRIQRNIKDPTGKTYSDGEVYDALSQIQRSICEEVNAMETSTTISVIGGTELYNIPDGMFGIYAMNSTSTQPLIKLNNMKEVADKKRNAAVTNTTDAITYYYQFNDQIGFLSQSGTAPTAADTVTLWYSRVPKTDLTEEINATFEPILDPGWDMVLEYGATWFLTKDKGYQDLYEKEKNQHIGLETAHKNYSYDIQVNRSYD